MSVNFYGAEKTGEIIEGLEVLESISNNIFFRFKNENYIIKNNSFINKKIKIIFNYLVLSSTLLSPPYSSEYNLQSRISEEYINGSDIIISKYYLYKNLNDFKNKSNAVSLVKEKENPFSKIYNYGNIRNNIVDQGHSIEIIILDTENKKDLLKIDFDEIKSKEVNYKNKYKSLEEKINSIPNIDEKILSSKRDLRISESFKNVNKNEKILESLEGDIQLKNLEIKKFLEEKESLYKELLKINHDIFEEILEYKKIIFNNSYKINNFNNSYLNLKNEANKIDIKLKSDLEEELKVSTSLVELNKKKDLLTKEIDEKSIKLKNINDIISKFKF